CNRPSATVSAVATAKPRCSMARASLVRNDLSSSTISNVRSPGIGAGATGTSVMVIIAILPKTCRSAMRQRSAAQALICDFEISARPAHAHDRALLGSGPVEESERRAGAFQQRFGDEKAKAEPALL